MGNAEDDGSERVADVEDVEHGLVGLVVYAEHSKVEHGAHGGAELVGGGALVVPAEHEDSEDFESSEDIADGPVRGAGVAVVEWVAVNAVGDWNLACDLGTLVLTDRRDTQI